MTNLDANLRLKSSKGSLNSLRNEMSSYLRLLYGGKEENELIIISKKHLKNLIDQENFLSKFYV